MADVTIKLVNGENYIGRGYHFKNGDTTVMTKKEAVPFLKILGAKGLPKFKIVDAELEAMLAEEDAGQKEPGKDVGKVITVDPRNLTEPKALRQWLRDHKIEVSDSATMKMMVPLIPDSINEILAGESGAPPEDDTIDL